MADEVDRIVEAWHRERPELDVTPLEVLSRVARLARHLDAARRAVLAREKLEPYVFDTLTALRRAGGELGAGRLATETLVASGTMTNRLDRLEAAGLAERTTDPSDGRAVQVRLTALGRATVDRAMEALLERERGILQVLPAAERSSLAHLLRQVVGSFEPTDGEG
ncbi:MAG TPA: MarR family transcriptional regulator [Acidimicrobiales bacterium]|nr:MarR family transcriptional regulator [Acidimicrobiales bacterium]